MAYIKDGKVVETKPFSLLEFVQKLWEAILLFFYTLFSSTPSRNVAEDYRTSRRPGQARGRTGWPRSLREYLAPTDQSGSGANGRNMGSFPPATMSGGCGGGS